MTGLQSVREALLNPVEALPDDPPGERGDPQGGGDGGRFARPPRQMPEGCPVIPVGTEDGVFYFITALGELRGLTPEKVSNNHVKAMFAPEIDFLMTVERWKQKKLVKTKDDRGDEREEWIVTGWRSQETTNDLLDVCAARGVWNAREKVRGRGAWKADDGSLILHCGNKVLIGGRWIDPGMHEKMVYPTRPAIPRPARRGETSGARLAPLLAGNLRKRGIEIADSISPAALLLELLKTWNWARPAIDPLLAIGWIGAAIVGGALDYRPIAWITGDAASGKSALQKLFGWLFENGILQSPEASEAGVRQTLGQESLPVGLDEAEASADNRKLLALVTLARLAATSQGNLLRGGQDHKATEFRATSCFLFSSVLVPPLTPADKSRLALLELGELPKGGRAPFGDQHRAEIEAIGGWLRRRFVDRWATWPAVREAFHDALLDYGDQSGRAADQFGTLAAAAHLLMSDDLPEEDDLAIAGDRFGRFALSETMDEAQEGPLCLDRLMSSQVALDRGGALKSVAEWVERAGRVPREGMASDLLGELEADRGIANDALGRIGMRVVGRSKKLPGELMLAICNSHQGLMRLFEGSKYYDGVWSQALGRLVGAVKDQNRLIDHRQKKCTLVPIALAIQREAAGEDVRVGEVV